jgi:hypothetical protein
VPLETHQGRRGCLIYNPLAELEELVVACTSVAAASVTDSRSVIPSPLYLFLVTMGSPASTLASAFPARPSSSVASYTLLAAVVAVAVTSVGACILLVVDASSVPAVVAAA